MLSKKDQLKKIRTLNPKKLSKTENKLFHETIKEITRGVCQLCEERGGDDQHHPLFGKYGADKDDRCQVLVCRRCHELCHKDKHGIINTRAKTIGHENFKEYCNTI